MVTPVSSPAAPTVGRGAVWRRWDSHIHTPGTILNSQFGETNAWDDYLERIENATPTVQAIGITDYWSLDRYEEVLEHRANGRLPKTGASARSRRPLVVVRKEPDGKMVWTVYADAAVRRARRS